MATSARQRSTSAVSRRDVGGYDERGAEKGFAIGARERRRKTGKGVNINRERIIEEALACTIRGVTAFMEELGILYLLFYIPYKTLR
jgi:hypothetical protein